MDVQEFTDKLIVEGVNAMGYGTIPKMVMRDRRLSATAKCIYAYFCSYAGAGSQAFPSVKLIIFDLQINKDTYYKHLMILKNCGYIKIEQQTDNGKFMRNIYTLIANPCPKISESETPCPNFSDTKISDTKISDTNNNKELKETVINIISQSEYEELTDGQTQSFINIVDYVLASAKRHRLAGVTPETITQFFDYWQKIPKGRIKNMERYLDKTIASFFKLRI